MESLLGFLFLLLIFLFILIWTFKHRYAKNFLLVAFLLRGLTVIFDHYNLITIKEGYGDASKFDNLAREFSRNEGLYVVFDFFKYDSLLVSRIISIFYTIFGESKMMAQCISVAFGVMSVYFVYKLSLILWDKYSAKNAAWVAAIFPTLILYSSITLREVYVVFFLLICLIGIAKFIKKNSLITFLIISFNFYILSLFHGPMAIGIFIFFIYLAFTLTAKDIITLYKLRLNIKIFLYIIILSILLYLFLNNQIRFPYIGGIEALINFDLIIPKLNNFITGNASYPSWLIINNIYEFLPNSIIKIFYFIYSPFIWDINKSSHIIGMLDGIFYIVLTIYLFQNWKAIWKNPITRIIVLILISYLIVYGISVGNFGTAIRHRSKFVVIFIVLVAPKIHKFIFSTKKKIYKN